MFKSLTKGGRSQVQKEKSEEGGNKVDVCHLEVFVRRRDVFVFAATLEWILVVDSVGGGVFAGRDVGSGCLRKKDKRMIEADQCHSINKSMVIVSHSRSEVECKCKFEVLSMGGSSQF